MNFHKYILLVFCFFMPFLGLCQIAGRQNFEFLRVPSHARLAGIGGVNITSVQEDVNAIWQNPALLNEKSAKHFGFNYSALLAGINQFALNYAHDFKRIGTVGFGLQTVNYGEMELTDPSGAVLGTFKASDFALMGTYALKQDAFTYGINLKVLGSQIETYNAYALAVDLGGTFKHPKMDLTLGLAIKNLGFGLRSYTPESNINLPFDVQMGVSFKPEYMPFRFSMTLHHLYQWDIVYLDPNQATQLDLNGNPITEEKTFFDKMARHVVLGGELLIAKGFNIRLGYNHLINREMKIQDLGGFRGFSFGLMLKVKAFEFGYSRGTYQIGAGRDFLTLTSNLNAILKKKKKKVE